MSTNKILKEVLGVDVFDLKMELVSESRMYKGQVIEGMLLANISFSSSSPLYKESYGSLYIVSRDLLTNYPGSITTFRYEGKLLYGEETEQIIQAFAKEFERKKMNHNKELKIIKDLLSDELYEVLKEAGAYVAGGALTSVFTNKEVNDIDVYFPSAEAFSNTVKAIYVKEEIPEGMLDWLDAYHALAVHISKRALLCTVNGQKVQFIAHRFYEKPQDIFKTFDFTVNMAVYDLKNDNLTLHDDFLKHLSQRYLHINAGTSYPLVSVLRVNKYKDKGFSCSKSQLLKLLLAVNKLKIETWGELFDQLGGMYGTAPEDIFDSTKPFSLDLAIETLDSVEFKETIIKNSPDYSDVLYAIPYAFPRDEVLSEVKKLQDRVATPIPSWYGVDYYDKEKKVLAALEKFLGE